MISCLYLFVLFWKAAIRLPSEYQAHQHASTSLAWSSCAITNELLKSLVQTQKKVRGTTLSLKSQTNNPNYGRVLDRHKDSDYFRLSSTFLNASFPISGVAFT